MVRNFLEEESFGCQGALTSDFPDCLARRKVGRNRWEEVRIEFEYESKSFVTHGHDPIGFKWRKISWIW